MKRLGSGLPYLTTDLGFPEFDRFYLKITLQAALCRESYWVYNAVMTEQSNCIICGTLLRGKQTRFCSSACKNKYHQSYPSQKDRGLTRKLKLIKAAGSCCSICGYRKNLAALAFHHTDSAEKDFKLDMRSLSNRGLKSVLAELDKCILVCHNCHAELHNPHLNLDSLLWAGRSNRWAKGPIKKAGNGARTRVTSLEG